MTQHAQGVTSEPFSIRSSEALFTGLNGWAAVSSECQRELMDFIQMRLEKNRAAAQNAMTIRNPFDAVGTQMQWVADMLNDYSQEFRKMAAIYTKLGPGRVGTTQAERKP
jgi:hypothetical protein